MGFCSLPLFLSPLLEAVPLFSIVSNVYVVGQTTKARSVLEQARQRNPKCPELWYENFVFIFSSGREFGTTGEKSSPRPFFFKSREIFGGGHKSQLSNSNPLVLKGLSCNLFFM